MSKIDEIKASTLYKFALVHKFIVLGFVASVIAVIALSSTMLADAIYFDDPTHKDVKLEAWMTPRYVALSYDLPRPIMMELLEIDEDNTGPRRLDRIAEEIGSTLDELTEKVRLAAIKYREQNGD